eukprot:39966_1
MINIAANVLFVVISFNICCCLDRSTFSNLHATEKHDGYMKFKQDIRLPLSVKWTKYIACGGTDVSVVVANNVFYCLKNIDWGFNDSISNFSLVALKVDDGSVLFETILCRRCPSWGSWGSSIVSIEPNYIAVVDNANAKIYLLNGSTGDIVHETLLYDGCPLASTDPCNTSLVVSSPVDRHSVIVLYWVENNNILKIFTWNIESNGMSYTNTSFWSWPYETPAICHNDTVVLKDDNAGHVGAFYMNRNNTMTPIWEYEIVGDEGNSISNPAFCVPTLEGGFDALVRVITNDSLYDQELERWNLIDGTTGELAKERIWNTVRVVMPSIHVDKMILAMATVTVDKKINGSWSDARESVVGYNITNHSQWDEIYKTTLNETYYQDMMIINDYIYALGVISNDLISIVRCVLDIFSIDDGQHVDRFTIPVDVMNVLGEHVDLSMRAGVGANGIPMIFIHVLQRDPNQSTLFALGSSLLDFETVKVFDETERRQRKRSQRAKEPVLPRILK